MLVFSGAHLPSQDTAVTGTTQTQDKKTTCFLKGCNATVRVTGKGKLRKTEAAKKLTDNIVCQERQDTAAYSQFNPCCNFVGTVALNKTLRAQPVLLSQPIQQSQYFSKLHDGKSPL